MKIYILLFFIGKVLATVCCASIVLKQTACDFVLRLALEDQIRIFECSIPFVDGPWKGYPDLRELLSFNRPVYNCREREKQGHLFDRPFVLVHRGRCWKLSTAEEPNIEVACLNSWAATPMNIETSTPNLRSTVNVTRCNPQSLLTFHVTDTSRVQKGVTSFFTAFARDIQSNSLLFYGISSRYFAWTLDNIWYFSAHWKNVGGKEYSRVQCISINSSLDEIKCLRLRDDLAAWDPAPMIIVYETDSVNSHQALINRRNQQRDPKSLHEFTLLNGLEIPMFGLGTGAMDPDLTHKSLETAHSLGYHLVDTAAIYENEHIVGEVFSSVNLRRPIIQTKVWPTELGFRRTLRSVMISRERLKAAVLDVVLLHWPRCYAEWNVDWMDCTTADRDDNGYLWLDSWRALERMYAEGFILAIGVSNFNMELLTVALKNTDASLPMIVQNEFGPSHLDNDVVQFCKQHGILYQGYALFRQGMSPFELARLRKAMARDSDCLSQGSERSYLVNSVLKGGIGFLGRSNNNAHLKSNFDEVEQRVCVSKSVFDLFDFRSDEQEGKGPGNERCE